VVYGRTVASQAAWKSRAPIVVGEAVVTSDSNCVLQQVGCRASGSCFGEYGDRLEGCVVGVVEGVSVIETCGDCVTAVCWN
jgi:hypothetical protein